MKRDGTGADVVLLRPDSWLEKNNAKVGGNVYIAVPECGIDGNAKVTNIEVCPPIADGPGQVVIGTFHHHSATVYDLVVEGQDQSIGVTGNHPFWSADRQDYIPAAELSIGERLLAFNGTPRVKSLIPRGPPQSVYNLEVLNHHTYHVTRQGLLVHNSNPCAPDSPRIADEAIEHGLSIKDPQWPWRGLHVTEGHHPLMQGKTYKDFWKKRGLTADEVDEWVVDLDTDIHRAITESGWWDNELLGSIAAQEKIHGTLGKHEVRNIAQKLLDEIGGWGK